MGAQIIVINGQKYDAKTGRLLEQTTAQPKPKHQGGMVLDGFSRRPKSARPVVAHAVHQKTEKSKTLMRGAVTKPVSNKVHSKTHSVARPVKKEDTKHATTSHHRMERATHVTKSSLISKFGAPNVTTSAHQPAKKPVVAHLPVKQAPAPAHHSSAHQPQSRHANPFANAVENAHSHEETKPVKSTRRHKVAKALHISPRLVSVGTTVLAIGLLGGFFVYQNIPNMAMRVASARSGVNAQMPDYKPGGFALNGPITYSAGKITVNYKSNSDDRSYRVSQSSSEWNSETLLDSFVAVDRRNFQTFQAKGKTIYIYDGSNATWVDRGVWYQIEGAASLSSDQLLRIANSL